LRISVASDVFPEVSTELGALIQKLGSGGQTSSASCEAESFVVEEQHSNDDVAYHANLRDHLSTLFSTLCDDSLVDALELASAERARRGEGCN
jgi:hypothetical protein